MSVSRSLPWLLLLAGGMAGCGGDGVVPDAGMGMLGGPPPPVSLTELQAALFTPRCAVSGCHAGPFPQAFMSLEDGHTFSNVVNVPSAEDPMFLRVEAGNADDSYLFMKLAGDGRISFARMPQVGSFLTPTELDAVRSWIEAGAQDD